MYLDKKTVVDDGLSFRKWSLLLLALSTLVVGTVDIGLAAEPPKPVMAPDGSIDFGAKSIRKREGYGIFNIILDNDIQCQLSEQFDFGHGYTISPFFLNIEDKIENNKLIHSADARASGKTTEVLGKYELSMELLPSGLIRIKSVLNSKDSASLKDRGLSIDIPTFMKFAGKYTKGSETRDFAAGKQLVFNAEQLKDAKMEFFPENPNASFTIIPEACSEIRIDNTRLVFEADKEGVLSFLLDLRGGEATASATGTFPNGIDVGNVDQLSVPDYASTKNLLLNPSFEAGFRFWAYRIFASGAIPLTDGGTYTIDDTVAHSGSHSLKIRSIPHSVPLGTFALPVIPGQEYTISFWARTEPGKTDSLRIIARSSDGFPMEGFADPYTPFIASDLTGEWKRYSHKFVPKTPFLSIYMEPAIPAQSDPPGYVWVDDFQIEKGGMTDFETPPVSPQLLSSARGNFLEFGKAPDFRLDLRAAPNSKGKVELKVDDFFAETVFEKAYSFETNAEGLASIKLDDLDKLVAAKNLRGVFSVDAKFQLDGAKEPFRDYFRFSIMNFLENTQRNKDIFNLTYCWTLQAGGTDMERFVKHERNIGFGSYGYDFLKAAIDLDPAMDKERVDLLAKYGFDMTGGRQVTDWISNGTIEENNGSLLIENLKTALNPSDELLKEYEKICEIKARRRPWVPVWYMSYESNPGMLPLAADGPSFAKFLIATYKGIKKGNPNAKVLIEGGPWNIDPNKGVKWIEEYIRETRKIDPSVKFDGAGGHTYVDGPEQLDGNIREYLRMLDRNGCGDWPLYFTEGGCYHPFNIPSAGITPYVYNTANYWYIGRLSYDLGRAERISAAFSARAWLVALKYQDRVKCMNDWFFNRYMDVDFTGRAIDKIPNTLGRILGNAAFYKDVKFTPYSRCYVFKQDDTGAPIAVVWGYKEAVDRFREEPMKVKFDFGGQKLTFVDLMENTVDFPADSDGRTVIPMTPFPLFIKGEPGTADQLVDAISAGIQAGPERDVVSVFAFPAANGNTEIVLQNNVPRLFEGEISWTLDGGEGHNSISIPAQERIQQEIKLQNDKTSFGVVRPFKFSCKINGENVTKLSGSFIRFRNEPASGLTVDGSAKDWEKYPSIDLGSGASVKVAVSGSQIYLAVTVAGANLTAEEVFQGLGVYIDPFEKIESWTAPKPLRGDLAVFELVREKAGSLGAFCQYVQGVQMGSGSSVIVAKEMQPRIKVKTSSSPEGAFVELSVPEEILSPLKLAAGGRFGLNLSVPLPDGTVKTLAPIANFEKPSEAGDVNTVMGVIVNDK